jgi:hypothetical protein
MAEQRRNSEHRPSPEALLEAAHREEESICKLPNPREGQRLDVTA